MEMMSKMWRNAGFNCSSSLLVIAALLGCRSAGSIPRPSHADERPEQNAWIPELQGWVTDLAGVLPDEKADRIARMLAAYEEKTSHEFALLTVEDLQGEEIESLSLRVAKSWSLGKADASNGLLIVLAKRDRRIRIEIANGLVDLIPDELAKKIIDRDMAPAFREGRFANGIEAGLQSLMDAASK